MRRRSKPAIPKVEAKPPVARKSLKNEGSRVRDLEKRLAEALEQQTATSEVLLLISSFPTDIQPVLDAVAASAARVCGATDAVIMRLEGQDMRRVGHFGPIPLVVPPVRRVTRDTAVGRAILECRPVHIHDILATDAAREYPESARYADAVWHTTLSVPLVREGVAIGAITIRRTEVRPFSDEQIGLLKTFADQAVIAIENVRLFKELEARNRDLTTALDRQTATSEILRVISSSPTDAQPVFDAILRSAVTLCNSVRGNVVRVDGDLVRLVATLHPRPEEVAAIYPAPLTASLPPCRAIRQNTIVHVPDVEAAGAIPPAGLQVTRAAGIRSLLVVPMRRNEQPIGAILIARPAVGPFPDEQIALLQTFADQAVIAIENARLFKELEARNHELTEALTQQTATSEVLGVISRSPTDIQPVLDTVVESSARLCEAYDASIVLRRDNRLVLAAHHGPIHDASAIARALGTISGFTLSLDRGTIGGRTVLDAQTVHIADVQIEAEEFPEASEKARRLGFHTMLSVPLMREGVAIGAIQLPRTEVRLFTERQVALLKTFADQAVIAIENVRLFTELQASNRELTTALDQQTATSDILRVISRSQTDVQPVFDAIVSSAVRLLQGYSGGLTRIVGHQRVLAAFTSRDPAAASTMRATYPRPADAAGAHGQAIRDRAPVNIVDMHTDLRVTEAGREAARLAGYQSVVTVPLLRQEEAIGVLAVTRREPGGFTDDEIALLRTFADQAAIAIENARLLSELQEKNESLTRAHAQVTEALEQQTATSEILRTIAQAQTDVQPVFDEILRSAVTLCGAIYGIVWRYHRDLVDFVAAHNIPPTQLEEMRGHFPRPIGGADLHPLLQSGHVINIPDIEADTHLPIAQILPRWRARGVRSVVVVPIRRETEVVGAIGVSHREVGAFSAVRIDLLRTFADQALIAIENVRLFTELEARTAALSRSVDQLTALGEVGRAISSTLDLETVLTSIVSRAVELSGLDGGVVFEYDEGTEEFVHRAATETGGTLAEARRSTRIRTGEGVVGRTALTLEPVQVPDITVPGAHESRLRENLIASGVRAVLAVPMVYEGRLIGSLVVSRNRPGDFPAETIELLRTFATQSALAIQNARLFHEIADKSRQLEAASQHKSEFLANMSHELRTPLNAILGFSEVLAQGMFGEVNEKQSEYLHDILESGRHLLSLINDILDLSKIEAGRMELERADFDLPSAIENALILVRERASRRGIRLGSTIDKRLGMIGGDERKVKQVLLNLLSNALKFTPEGGQIGVAAHFHDDRAEVSVADTGIGIAPTDQDTVFEEFRQVGTADKKAEGTGLGLALSRKFIELHGGRIWVKSQVGMGSTFTFTLPLTIDQRRQ